MLATDPVIQNAVNSHGASLISAVLEGLCRSRTIRLESVPHGFFVKCFYKKYDLNNMNTQVAAPTRPPY